MSNPHDDALQSLISASALAECSFSIAQEYAMEYLRLAEAEGPESTIRVPLPAPFGFLRHHVTLSFGLHSDVLEGGRAHDEVRFYWKSGSRLLPDFRGTMRFRIEGLRTRVDVAGGYAVPGGAFGYSFDRIVGKRLARASLQELADRVCSYLGKREATWRSEHVAAAV